jgi:hypothetical protein
VLLAAAALEVAASTLVVAAPEALEAVVSTLVALDVVRVPLALEALAAAALEEAPEALEALAEVATLALDLRRRHPSFRAAPAPPHPAPWQLQPVCRLKAAACFPWLWLLPPLL